AAPVPGAYEERLPSTPDSLVGLLYAPFPPASLTDRSALPPALQDPRPLLKLHRLLGGSGVRQGGLVRTTISPSSEDAIVERAIRSLYDWRSTLRFLSELALGKDGRRLSLVEPAHQVIDNFNVHITRGRKPNLIHTMLSHLRLPARMRLI